jgi:hypothetical protein
MTTTEWRKQITDKLLVALRHEGQLLPHRLNALAEEHLHEGANPDKAFGRNSTEKLYAKSNKLTRALVPNATGNISKANVQLGGIDMTYGIELEHVPYARIHDKGGTITIQKTPAMRRFFWARYFATKADMFRRAALSKKSSITLKIKARPFLNPVLAEFKEREVASIERRILEAMAV